MKVMVAGLGSMGKRRVRNLQAIGVEEIVGCDTRHDRRAEAEEEYGIPTLGCFAEGLAEGDASKMAAMSASAQRGLKLRIVQCSLDPSLVGCVQIDRWHECVRKT